MLYTTPFKVENGTIYDADGNECFRSISLWILMDEKSRAMVLPGKSGVEVGGLLRGCELSAPSSLIPKEMGEYEERIVRYTDLATGETEQRIINKHC